MSYPDLDAAISAIPQPSPAVRIWVACDKLWDTVKQDVLGIIGALNAMIHADTSLSGYSLELISEWEQQSDPEKVKGQRVSGETLSAFSENTANIRGVIWDAYSKKGYRLVQHNTHSSLILKLTHTWS